MAIAGLQLFTLPPLRPRPGAAATGEPSSCLLSNFPEENQWTHDFF
jgi:hypothetical protein